MPRLASLQTGLSVFASYHPEGHLTASEVMRFRRTYPDVKEAILDGDWRRVTIDEDAWRCFGSLDGEDRPVVIMDATYPLLFVPWDVDIAYNSDYPPWRSDRLAPWPPQPS